MSVFSSPARGREVPPHTPHSILFSLPGWDDTVELGRGNKTILDSLETTYPRFVINTFVEQARSISIPYPIPFVFFFSHKFFFLMFYY